MKWGNYSVFLAGVCLVVTPAAAENWQLLDQSVTVITHVDRDSIRRNGDIASVDQKHAFTERGRAIVAKGLAEQGEAARAYLINSYEFDCGKRLMSLRKQRSFDAQDRVLREKTDVYVNNPVSTRHEALWAVVCGN